MKAGADPPIRICLRLGHSNTYHASCDENITCLLTVVVHSARDPMPRIATVAILQARTQHPLLPLLLRECRSLPSAKNELRWLYERALCIVRSMSKCQPSGTKQRVHGWRSLLKSMCLARSRGVPLQYILGDQPFGELDIKCTRGVLIPRYRYSN